MCPAAYSGLRGFLIPLCNHHSPCVTSHHVPASGPYQAYRKRDQRLVSRVSLRVSML